MKDIIENMFKLNIYFFHFSLNEKQYNMNIFFKVEKYYETLRNEYFSIHQKIKNIIEFMLD
jgi:hypothetical protein